MLRGHAESVFHQEMVDEVGRDEREGNPFDDPGGNRDGVIGAAVEGVEIADESGSTCA